MNFDVFWLAQPQPAIGNRVEGVAAMEFAHTPNLRYTHLRDR